MTTREYVIQFTVLVDLDQYESYANAGQHEPGPFAAAHILEAAEERLEEAGGWAKIGNEVRLSTKK